MTNLVVSVTLPKGLKLKTGAFLAEKLSVEVIADLSPFYTSVPSVRLEGGPYMGKVKDTTIAAQIYQSSKKVDLKQDTPPKPDTPEGKRFYRSRNLWVLYDASLTLINSISGMIGYAGGHVLANFSVTRGKGEQGTGIAAKMNELKSNLAQYQVVIESAGRVIPGGHVIASMAAKGLLNNEIAPGRTWITTGMGANSTSPEFMFPGGGRGKPMKFFLSPIISVRYMDGRFMGAIGARGALEGQLRGALY